MMTHSRSGSTVLAVLIPAHNEREGIARTIGLVAAALGRLQVPTEILVVDDGSTDGTGAIAASAGARVVTHRTNLGYGAALRTGLLRTQAEAVAIIDGDCSYAADALPRLYELLGDADMVVGARSLSSNGVPWMRRPGKWLLNRFASYLVGRDIPDLNSGQRVMRRDTALRYLHLMPSGFSFTSTMTLAMLSNGHEVVYEPVSYEPRVGRSKLKAAHFGSILLLIVRAIVLFSPLKVFLPLGALLFFVGVAKLVEDVGLWNLSETAVMAFLSAIIVWAVGLLADMISRLQLQPYTAARAALFEPGVHPDPDAGVNQGPPIGRTPDIAPARGARGREQMEHHEPAVRRPVGEPSAR